MKKNIIIITIIIFLISSFLYVWARYVETKGLNVKEYKISTNISDNFNGLKIVHFSDLHYSSTVNKSDLKKIVDKINFINTDIIVFTGDLIDISDSEKIKEVTSELKRLNAKIGKYAVNGDKDINEFDIIMKNCGFTVLNNSYELIYKNSYDSIIISGITSNLKDNDNVSNKLKTTYEYLEQNNAVYKILLTHEPDIIDNTNIFDLVLAGHSHNSQINLPIIRDFTKIDGAKKYYLPYYKVNNTNLYISGGLGTANYKLRFLNKPSINFYRIVKE